MKKPKKLTKDQKETYLAACGNHCPYCNGNDLECGNLESDHNQAWREVTCLTCGKVWEDIYTLTDVMAKD